MVKISEIKKGKVFKLKDVILFSVILLIIALCFISYFVKSSNKQAGFRICVSEETYLEYVYQTDEITVYKTDSVITEKDNDYYYLTVYTDSEKTQFNKIKIDTVNRTVCVIDSNCSSKKDCVHSLPLSNAGAIICKPHNLKIVPLYNDYVPITTG